MDIKTKRLNKKFKTNIKYFLTNKIKLFTELDCIDFVFEDDELKESCYDDEYYVNPSNIIYYYTNISIITRVPNHIKKIFEHPLIKMSVGVFTNIKIKLCTNDFMTYSLSGFRLNDICTFNTKTRKNEYKYYFDGGESFDVNGKALDKDYIRFEELEVDDEFVVCDYNFLKPDIDKLYKIIGKDCSGFYVLHLYKFDIELVIERMSFHRHNVIIKYLNTKSKSICNFCNKIINSDSKYGYSLNCGYSRLHYECAEKLGNDFKEIL